MIRPARPADQPACAALLGGRGLGLAPTGLVLLDERDGRVEGCVHVEALGAIGFVRHLVVADRERRTGDDAALMLAAAAALRTAGVREWHLDVSTEDAAGIRLSETLGLREEHRSTAMRLPWSAVDTLPREPATALPVTDAEDDDVERALGLLGGQIAMARRRGTGHVLRQLRDAECAAVGFAAFDLDLPGARVFQVARPALAGPLLAALRPFARHDGLSIVIEDHEALAALLIAHGGVPRRQLRHYGGPIPASEER